MANPFVYGEVVPAAAFVDREVELERLADDLRAGQKIFLISPRRYGKSSLVRQALAAVVAERRADRRGHRQQLQLVRRVPRGLRPGAGVDGDAPRAGDGVAARPAERGPRRGPGRTGPGRQAWQLRVAFPAVRVRARRLAAGPGGVRACPAGSPKSAAGGWRSRSTSSRRSAASTAAASSTRCAPRCRPSGRSATSSPDPSRR